MKNASRPQSVLLTVTGLLVLVSQIHFLLQSTSFVSVNFDEQVRDEPLPRLESTPRVSRRVEEAGSTAGQSKDDEVLPRPEGWEYYGYHDARKHFDCEARKAKSLPTLEDWELFRSAFKETVDPAAKFDDPIPPTRGYTLGFHGPPPFRAGPAASGRGRGLIASKDIKKGEIVHDGSDGDVLFPDAASWRDFVFSLPREEACDAIDWTRTRKQKDGKHRIFSSLNLFALLQKGSGKNQNVGRKSSRSPKLFALRDIQAGERLATTSGHGQDEAAWEEVGLGDARDKPVDSEEPWPLPSGWESYGFIHVRHYFNCRAHSHDQTKPLPSLEDWKQFQVKYREIVDPTATFDDPVPPTEGYTLGDGSRAPFRPGRTPDGRGRGLYAARDIKRGELVHDGDEGDVLFPDAASFRRYVFSLPRKKACDMTDWCWTQENLDGRYRVYCSLNVSILINSSKKEANVNPKSSRSSKYYALRDIEENEELIMYYGVYKTDYDIVGL
ncbi:hypothetical protein ACHAWF_018393 [Thalassiosira exigua]